MRIRTKEEIKALAQAYGYGTARIHLHKYGITREESLKLLAEQDYECAICGRTLDFEAEDRRYRPALDHDHETNRVRGWLCSNCNSGLAGFRDKVHLLYAAAEYLERSRS